MTSYRSAAAVLAVCLAPTLSCRATPAKGHATEADAASQACGPEERVAAIRVAENQRDSAAVHDDDLASPEVRLRRAAAMALARIAAPKSSERLLLVLADRDPETLAWAAYGLGEVCEKDRDRITRALIARALTLSLEPAPQPGALEPWHALARALGKCATPEAETTLAAWLDAPRLRAAPAALGLGDVASQRKRIAEETAADLLRAAAGDAARDPLPEAFYPFGRLKVQPPRAVEHERQVAAARLAHAAEGRVFVLRALGKTGEAAVDALAQVAATPASFTTAERVEAARALGRLGGRKAQAALAKLVEQLSPPCDPVGLSSLVGPGFHPLLTALQGLEPAAGRGEKRALEPVRALAELKTPPNAPPALNRRVTALRCEAARVLAGEDADDPALVGCDPAGSPAGALARLAVLGSTKLQGSRLTTWRGFLDSKYPPRVREAALQLLGTHPEIPGAATLLAAALGSTELGVVAVAAEIITQNPERASDEKAQGGAGAPSPALEKALSDALARPMPPDALEIQAELLRAAGALRLQSARPSIETACRSAQPALREAARAALASMDGKKVACEADPSAPSPPAAELGRLLPGPVKVQWMTDAGPLQLTLDPSLAPVAATRIAELVAKGFYSGIEVHRVVAGYVVQFGDPWGDGYGGAGLPPLRCETSPVPFVQGTVGVALGGRDTGSSQLFVTLSSSPHIDGGYAVIGKAEGPWDTLVQGDVIEKAAVVK